MIMITVKSGGIALIGSVHFGIPFNAFRKTLKISSTFSLDLCSDL